MNAIGSKFLCWINAWTFRESLGVSKSIAIEFEQFNEEKNTKIYRESTNEEKGEFLSKILNPG